MKPFEPEWVFFEPEALNYPLGEELYRRYKGSGIPVRMTTSHNRVTGIPGRTEAEKYRNAKRTLVVGVRKTLQFDTSKPSAEYALPLATGCMGHCHYCYLQTTMGNRPTSGYTSIWRRSLRRPGNTSGSVPRRSPVSKRPALPIPWASNTSPDP